MPHLYVALTAHGYGHLAQVAPVAHALGRRFGELRITVQSTLPSAFVDSRMPPNCRQIHQAADVVLPMDGSLHVRWEEGLDLYRAFDAEHDRRLARQCALLRGDPPDLLLADVPWLPLQAARVLGIPAVGLCSLNWYDILAESPIARQIPAALSDRLRSAYAGADLFLRPAPSMPMSWLPNGCDIGPIATCRPRCPAVIRQRLGIDAGQSLALMQFGGAGCLRLGEQQRLPADVHLLTPDAVLAAERGRISLIDVAGTGADVGSGSGVDLLDVLASCDVVITKPGYGTFAEAACNGIPVLYVRRGDWPEEPHLVHWLEQQVPTRAVSSADFAAGRITGPLLELLDSGPVAPVPATGVDETVELLAAFLKCSRNRFAARPPGRLLPKAR